MVTKNFKNLLAMALESSATVYGRLPVRGVDGVVCYLAGQFTFPSSRTGSPTLDASAAGISIGTGGGAESEDICNLEATITEGVSLTLSETSHGCDALSGPYVLYKLTCTNNTAADITVREIGYKQTVSAARYPDVSGSTTASAVCLIDRTLLSAPVTIAAGDAGVLDYKLQTIPNAPETIAGVEIVSWTSGTDEQIAAMLAAAHSGTIDLQTDAHWHVGDMRVVDVGAFTGGGSVSHAAQKAALVISSFDEYEGCGNVMQIDFADGLTASGRMNATGTNVGGYGASEMKTVTLPALAEALPNWLKNALITFSVKASKGNESSVVETVTGNKLALRSEIEVMGMRDYSPAGEGALVRLYQNNYYLTKFRGMNKTTSTMRWWLRSPNPQHASTFLRVEKASVSIQVSYSSASSYESIAPFGCL